MGLELDLVSEHLAMAAGSRLEGVTDEVPLLARTKDIDVLSDSRPVAYDNFHPLKAQTKVKEVEVVCDKVDGLQASRSGEEDNAPLLEKSRVASDERQDEIITTSNCCSSSSKGVEQELHHAPASNGIPAQSDSLEEMEVKYAAYVRSDAYGTWGAGQWTLCEIIKLGFAAVILAPIRVVLLLSILVLFYLICRICTLFRTPSEQDGLDDYGHLTGGRRSVIVNSGRFCARLMLFVLGFYQINVTESDAEVMNLLQLGLGDAAGNSSLQAGAIVSNHISYLDILYHMSASFPSFVAKRSVARIPLVGLISKCLGCIYVQRESKTSDFKGVSGVVVERLQAASQNENAPSVLLFPEGTTTNGDYLLPFKTGAFVARTPVLPVILRYPYERFSPAWDTITGVRHICLLLCQFINYLEVKRLPVYYPTAKECSDPKLYAQNVRRLMAAEGKLTLSEIGLPEKRIYHAALRGNSLPKVWDEKHGKSD